MNRKKRTALWILLALAAVIGGLCIWQRDNLRALVLSRSMTQEKFTEQISQQQAKTEQAAQEAGVTVRPMTEEEKELLHSGEEDRDALIDRLTQAQKPNQPPEQTEQAPQEQPEQPDPQAALRAKQTTSAKYDIGMKYLSEALKKEKECDAKMQDVETRIRDLLTQLGESTSLADEIHAAYTEKKATLKAYYLGLH